MSTTSNIHFFCTISAIDLITLHKKLGSQSAEPVYVPNTGWMRQMGELVHRIVSFLKIVMKGYCKLFGLMTISLLDSYLILNLAFDQKEMY